MNIIIRCDDSFYKFGLTALLAEIFQQEDEQQTVIFADYHPDKIRTADILVAVLRPGEAYLCHPELLHCKAGLMIGIVEQRHVPARGELPDCLRQIVLMAHNATVDHLRNTIAHHWPLTRQDKDEDVKRSCVSCSHKRVSDKQQHLIRLLLSGLTSRQIGAQMNIGQKTVLAHRHALMHKFRLRSDCELMQFLVAKEEKYPHRGGEEGGR
ncbi:helix-turn-helix transcriptional regulator [Citrobacter sedlakii]|uniref:helix-turn-helix transcriptional regulator n=1 Tax=Citrobacter sedlakii TaxID=67826 RepID=UPI0005A8965F|nr:helix-turn-helix transcriptional regulator [Citrobacter sedlakii]